MGGNSVGTELSGVLQSVLKLGQDDQKRLRDILCSLTNAPTASLVVTPAVPAPADTGAEASESTVSEWLEQIKEEAPWSQLRLLDDALERADDESEMQLLRAARSRLMQENPPIAVRHAVVRLASERPVAVITGAVGLVLALVALGRGLFHLLF